MSSLDDVPGDLLEAARSVIANAYAPYSNFRVAAAVRAGSGRVYVGVNVENSSYGLTVCAERVAVFNAITNGEREVREVLVAVESGEPVPPCGACLQVISEFSTPDTTIYMVSLSTGKAVKARLGDLLPRAFKFRRLNPERPPG